MLYVYYVNIYFNGCIKPRICHDSHAINGPVKQHYCIVCIIIAVLCYVARHVSPTTFLELWKSMLSIIGMSNKSRNTKHRSLTI